jgi:hypothetical protein
MPPPPPSIEPLESRIAPATFTVTTLGDHTDSSHDIGSLRDAILQANASTDSLNTIVFDVHGAINLAANLPPIHLQLGSSLSILGPKSGKSNGIVIDGDNHVIFSILSGSVTLQDISVTHGLAAHSAGSVPKGGGLYINDSSPVQLTDVKVSGNRAIGRAVKAEGGGIYISAGSSVTVTNSVITGNSARGTGRYDSQPTGYGALGGGIICLGTLTLDSSVVSNNLALGQSDLATLGLNGGSAKGGGIYASSAASITITGSTLSGNQAIGGAGGFGEYYAGLSAGATTAGNGGAAIGGALAASGATITISGSKFTGNIARAGNGGAALFGVNSPFFTPAGIGGPSSGGGLSILGGSLSLQTSSVSGNLAAPGIGSSDGIAKGGGLYSTGTASLFEVTLSKNRSNDGGGISLYSAGNTILGTTISGNRARLGGGIQIADAGALTIQDSTVANNFASLDGGGLDIGNGATVNIHNDTIAGNIVAAATGVGGGIDASGSTGSTGSVSIISTIIAGNKASIGADLISQSNAVLSISFDLIQQTPIAGTYTNNGNNIFNESPQLGPLANNGGPTLTMLPKLTSPVVNTGDNPDSLTTDQRGTGFARTVGTGVGASDGTDIGAIELQIV